MEDDESQNNQLTESELKLKKFITQFCHPEQFKNNEVSGFASILGNICEICCENANLFSLLSEQNIFMEKFSHDWTGLLNKFCSDTFYSKNAGLHLHASISLVKNLTDKHISLVTSLTNWEALVFSHLDKIALKRYYVKDYLMLTRKFLCYRYASRSPDVKQHINLMQAVFKSVQNESKRISLYSALNFFSFSPELQFAPEFRHEMTHVHELGREIFGKIVESLSDGAALQDREIFWIEEINVYLGDILGYKEKWKHLVRQIGDYLVETNFLNVVAATLDHVVLRPPTDGNVLKLLAGTYNVSGLLQILWTLDESLHFSHYLHHTNIATKLVRLFSYLLSSGIARKDYDRTINQILKSMRFNCLNGTELKEEFYQAQILTVFEKNLQVLLQKQTETSFGVVFVTIYITAILGNSEELADCLHNKSNVKVLASICNTITGTPYDPNKPQSFMKMQIENFGEVNFAEVIEVLLAYERDKGYKLIAESTIVDSLLKTLELPDLPKNELKDVTLILFTLSLVEQTQEPLIRKNVYDVCYKVKKEINDAFALRCLNGILWQLSGSFEFHEYELLIPENEKISVYVCAAEKDKAWRKKFSDILALKGFQVITEETIKALQLQMTTEFEPEKLAAEYQKISAEKKKISAEQNAGLNECKKKSARIAKAAVENHARFEKLAQLVNLNMNKDSPLWALAIAESHLVISAMSHNLEKDKFCRMQIQFAKQLEKDIRFVDLNEDDYNPQNWLFEAMQKCFLYNNVNKIKLENVKEQLKRAKESNNGNQQSSGSYGANNASTNQGKKERRQSLINPIGLISRQNGSNSLVQWSSADIQQWLDLIKAPKAKEPFQNFSGVELNQLKERCQDNAAEFGRFLRDNFQLDLYSQKQLKNAFLQM